MMDDFLLRAVIAGLGVACVSGPLGCFIIWRRMAYFGDTMAHSALLGVAVGFLAGIDVTVGVIGVSVLVAILLVSLQRTRWLATDTLLGILSHTALSFGLVAIGLMAWLRLDLFTYLFGDILAVTMDDVVAIWAGGAVVLAILCAIWRPLLAATVHEDLARAEGVPALPVRLAFMLIIAAVIALAMKIVGILLITSLLIIPAAAARRFASTPEGMAIIAAFIGMVAVVCGLFASLDLDTPAGPSIVAAAAILFALSLIPLPARNTDTAPADPEIGRR
jgi:zinc transport system permease protein